jgi:queuine tRNA-ribosyltransferase
MTRPIEPGCQCYTCRTFSASYLHHLFVASELLAYRLATIHNLTFISNLMRQARGAILDGTFTSFREGFNAGYRPTDEETRISQKRKWLETRYAPPDPGSSAANHY